jgi:hypothetical protein
MPALHQTEGGIFDDTELLAALGEHTGTSNEGQSSLNGSRASDETRRNSKENIAPEEVARGRPVVMFRDFVDDEDPISSGESPDGLLSVDTELGRGGRPVMRSLSTLDTKGSEMDRSSSNAGLRREGRARRRRGVSFDEHVFVMEEPGVMFALKHSGPLTPFTPSPVTPGSAGLRDSPSPVSDRSPGSPVDDDSDTEYSLGQEETGDMDLGVASAPVVSSNGESPPRNAASEHIQWKPSPSSSPTRTARRVGPERKDTGPLNALKTPASPGSQNSSPTRGLRQMFCRALGLGD